MLFIRKGVFEQFKPLEAVTSEVLRIYRGTLTGRKRYLLKPVVL